MKKLLAIIICLLLLTAGTFFSAFAAEEEAAPRSGVVATNIHFIKPVALTASGERLFVADNVSENQSVILCFDVSNGQPTLTYTKQFFKEIKNISSDGGKLYVIFKDSVEIFSLSGETAENSVTYNISDVVDFARANNTALGESNFALTNTSLVYDNGEGFKPFGRENLSQTKACVALGDTLYFMHYDETAKKIVVSALSGVSVSNLSLANFTFDKMTAYGSELLLANGSEAFITKNQTLTQDSAPVISRENGSCLDVAASVLSSGRKIFILNNQNKIDVYSETGGKFVKENYQIGSETVKIDGDIPTLFTGYTLIRSKGYPTNIVYKTENAANSIPDILIDYSEEMIALNFEGADQLPYYYVLVGDRYGWIKKSDNASDVLNDAKIEVINTQVGGNVTYKAKFVSPSAVYLYELPLSQSKTTQYTQTATNRYDVTVLQKFEEKTDSGEKIWYYVSFADGGVTRTGFIEDKAVGQFHGAAENPDEIEVLYDRKINASLFSAVNMHMTEKMSESETVCDSKGDPVKLFSGQRVTVIEEKANASFVQIRRNDGSADYGWVRTASLVQLNAMTTNAIVGLAVLAFAILFAVLFILLFVKGKKRAKRNAD